MGMLEIINNNNNNKTMKIKRKKRKKSLELPSEKWKKEVTANKRWIETSNILIQKNCVHHFKKKSKMKRKDKE